MPGKVSKIPVSIGQPVVKKGDVLVYLGSNEDGASDQGENGWCC
jgi:multidrug efflux pump subunit AcrA (membrane-fusion protein)